MSDCVFCKIRDGQIPSARIDEDERTITFMDINPLSRGHCLVATKRHAPTLFDSDEDDLAAVMATAKRVAGAIRRGLEPDGLNLLQANGAAAFQSVPALPPPPDPALDRRRQGIRLAAGARGPRRHPEDGRAPAGVAPGGLTP